jgi:branched-chain amino acid transport system permease protein
MQFAYRSHGDPDGLPMLLLHGSYASSRWWEPFFAILPTEISAIAPDLRGCGESFKSDSGYSIEDQAEDIWAFVQALAWTRFDLVAHSSGGAIAMEFALRHREVLRSLILVDTVPAEGIFTPLDTYMVLERMQEDMDLLEKALSLLMPSAPGPSMANDTFQFFFRQLVNDAQQMASAAFTEVARALARWNRFEAVGQLTLPTLLVWGDKDAIVDRDAIRRTLVAIPGANNLEVLRGVGHSPMIESPIILAEKIIEFIAEDFDDFTEIRRLTGNT